MGYLKTYDMISMVALLVVMSVAVAGWSTIEGEVSVKAEVSPCTVFDRWSPREAERHQFISCIAPKIGLQNYSVEDVEVTNEWHRKYGFSLAIKHMRGRKSCSQSNDVWYLDRENLKVTGFENEQIVCEMMFTD